MASELYVETLKGLTSGANANKVIIPSGQTLDASAGGFTTPAGHVIQVVQSTYGTRADISSTSYQDTGLSASITPSNSNNKILVAVTQIARVTPAGVFSYIYSQIVRNSTGVFSQITGADNNSYDAINLSMSYLDSPSTTSSVTYKTQGYAQNAGASDALTFQYNDTVATGFSSIILMEIAQ